MLIVQLALSAVCALLVDTVMASCRTRFIVTSCPDLLNVTRIPCRSLDPHDSSASEYFLSSSAGGQITMNSNIGTDNPSDTPLDRPKPPPQPSADGLEHFDIIEKSACYEPIFHMSEYAVQKAPLYVPNLNSIIYSQMFDDANVLVRLNSIWARLPFGQKIGQGSITRPSPDADQESFEQRIVDLNGDQPTLSKFITNPPIYGVSGGQYYNGSVYWAVKGGFITSSVRTGQVKHEQPGIYRLDPLTGHVETLVTEYQGRKFNSPNDLAIDSFGDIWFTDSRKESTVDFGLSSDLPPATYRFHPSTGDVMIVESTLVRPSAINFSPDGSKLYITNEGASPPELSGTHGTALYSFDVLAPFFALSLIHPRIGGYLVEKEQLLWSTSQLQNGFQVTRDGHLLGVDKLGSLNVLNASGNSVRDFWISTVFVGVQPTGMALVGEKKDEIWLFGADGIGKLQL